MQEKEVAMAAELEERTAKERAIREEAAAKRRAELEAKVSPVCNPPPPLPIDPQTTVTRNALR